MSLVCITGHHLPDGSEAMISECVKTYGGMKEWSPSLQSCAGIIYIITMLYHINTSVYDQITLKSQITDQHMAQ